MNEDSAQIVCDEYWEPDEIDTFLFSAALWLPHRIHYDLGFALSQGHRGLVVHGPLQTARLLEAVTALVRPDDGRIVSCRFRHESSIYVGDRVRILVQRSAPGSESPAGALRVGYSVRTEIVNESEGVRTATSGDILVEFRPAQLTRSAEPGTADESTTFRRRMVLADPSGSTPTS